MSSNFTVVTNLRSFRLGSGVFVPRKSTIGVVEHGFFTGAGPWGRVVQCPRKGCSDDADDDDDDVPLVLILSVSINGGSPLVGLFHGKSPHLIAG